MTAPKRRRPIGRHTLSLLPYFLPHLALIALARGIWLRHAAVSTWFAMAFILVVALDVLIPPACESRVEHFNTRYPSHPRVSTAMLRLIVPLHLVLVAIGLAVVTSEGLSPWDRLTLATVIAFAGGMIAIAAAHELLHHRNPFDRALAQITMTVLAFPQFCVEHDAGHHRHVGTVQDPSTARLGQDFYHYYHRALWGGLLDAWSIEASRLRELGREPWSLHNRLLRSWLILALGYVVVGFGLGPIAVTFLALQGVGGLSSVTLINYVQHYGLLRREIAPARWERVMSHHSWECCRVFGNWLTFDLPRHAEHHCDVEPFNHDEAPHLPGGFFAAFWLALVPFLWRRVMDPRVAAWRVQHGIGAPQLWTSSLQREGLAPTQRATRG